MSTGTQPTDTMMEDDSTNTTPPGAAALLRFADSIQGHTRRLENLGAWRDVQQRNFGAEAEGEQRSLAALLRHIQAARAGGTDSDVGFFLLCMMAEGYAERIFDTDSELSALSAKIRAVERREGLEEFDEFDPDHPETPADWKALNAESKRRYQEVEKISHDRLAGWLRRHGETDMADLYASDRDAFDRRREAGRSQVHDTPEMKAMRKARTDAPKAGRDEESARGTPGLLK